MSFLSFDSSRRYSLHQIWDEQLTFSPRQFSRFKFGDDSAAKEFGSRLAVGFIQAKLHNNPTTDFAVAVSYVQVPTAAYYLRKHFVWQLNQWLLAHDGNPCKEVQIKRKTSFYEDFGLMSAEEREQHMIDDDFEIDVQSLVGKTLIVLDDIRITGSHERRLLQMLDNLNITNDIFMVYFAELCNPHIDVTVENLLNFYAVGNIEDVATFARSNTFSLNARFVKYILSQDGDDFTKFIRFQDDKFLDVFGKAARDNDYWRVGKYISNLHRLEAMMAPSTLYDHIKPIPNPTLYPNSV